MNLLNFFNTFGTTACTGGVGGSVMECRGADDAGEFARQWPKTVAAIVKLDADIIGIGEIENDGYGPDSAIQFLVDKLNAATAPGTYAFVDADAGTGQPNALGSDAIKVGLLYKPAAVLPIGATAALNSVGFVNGGDSGPRNRPALAQAFVDLETGVQLVVSPNHLKSKGSACDVPDSGDGQANCAVVRTNAANLLASWLPGGKPRLGDRAPRLLSTSWLRCWGKPLASQLHHELQPSQGTDHHAAHQLPGQKSGWRELLDRGRRLPNTVANWLTAAEAPDRRVAAFLQVIAAACASTGPLTIVMPWFAQGVPRRR